MSGDLSAKSPLSPPSPHDRWFRKSDSDIPELRTRSPASGNVHRTSDNAALSGLGKEYSQEVVQEVASKAVESLAEGTMEAFQNAIEKGKQNVEDGNEQVQGEERIRLQAAAEGLLSSTVETTTDKRPPFVATEQIVIILCGYPGSGKSTFAQALQEHRPEFVRCNQDDLGDRKSVERLVRSSLKRGLSVCVDRTNIDVKQRQTWVDIAREFTGTAVWMLHFDISYDECAARLRTRTNHPTIANAEIGLSVLSRFVRDFVPPSTSEGFDRMISAPLHPSPNYSLQDVEDVLYMLRDSPPVVFPPRSAPAFVPRASPNRGRGYPRHGARGGHRGWYNPHNPPVAAQEYGSGSGSGRWADGSQQGTSQRVYRGTSLSSPSSRGTRGGPRFPTNTGAPRGRGQVQSSSSDANDRR